MTTTGNESGVKAADASPGRRFAEFEAYRGIAALLVVIFHAYQYTREGTGAGTYLYEGTPLHTLIGNLDSPVAWFFSLSGFLLFLPIARTVMQGRDAQRTLVFVFRRALRILPLYLTVYLIVWALRYANVPGQWTDLVQHLTFTHVWDARYVFWTIGPAWSLGNEVIYYAMLAVMGPLLVRFTRNAASADRARWVLAFPAALVLTGLLYKVVVFLVLDVQGGTFNWKFNPVAHVDTFAMGMLLAGLVAVGVPALGRAARSALVLGALALTAFTFVTRFSVPWVDVFVFSLAGAAFTLFLASTVLAGRGASLSRALSGRGWLHLGLISYGVYLWHEPIMLEFSKRALLISPEPGAFWVNAAVLSVITIALASVTYALVERPFDEARGLMTPAGRMRDDYRLERERYEQERDRERGPGD